jgi:hypothetical protein
VRRLDAAFYLPLNRAFLMLKSKKELQSGVKPPHSKGGWVISNVRY